MSLWEAEARRQMELRMAELKVAHDSEVARLKEKVGVWVLIMGGRRGIIVE